jgi:hypothetical protein
MHIKNIICYAARIPLILRNKPPWSRVILSSTRTDTQETPCHSCNSKVHYRDKRSLPMEPDLWPINSVHIHTSDFYKIRFNIIFVSISLGSRFFLSSFLNKNSYEYLTSPQRVTFPVHLILEFVTLIPFWTGRWGEYLNRRGLTR